MSLSLFGLVPTTDESQICRGGCSMASEQTNNYGLNQWAAEDRVLREEFNRDNAKADAALGRILEIASGTYIGTGERGSEHPNTLTFPFPPQLVLIAAESPNGLALGTIVVRGQRISGGVGVTGVSGHGLYLYLAWEGNTLSWYTSSSFEYNQLNTLNITYRYWALG